MVLDETPFYSGALCRDDFLIDVLKSTRERDLFISVYIGFVLNLQGQFNLLQHHYYIVFENAFLKS